MTGVEKTNLKLINREYGKFRQGLDTDADEAELMAAFAAGWNAQVDQLKKELAIGVAAVGRIGELEAKIREERKFSAATVDDLVDARAERDEMLAVCKALVVCYDWNCGYHDAGDYSDIAEMARTAVAKAKDQAPS